MAKEFNKYILEVLDYYGETTTTQMKNILIKNSKRATGNLINSIDYDIRKNRQGFYYLDLDWAPYGNFVAGRDKNNEPGYSPTWKTKGPPVRAMKKWLRAKNIRFASLNGRKLSREKKIDIMAFLIIRKIKKRKKLSPLFKNPTDFIKPAEKILNSKVFNKDVTVAMRKDITDEIKYYLKNKR